MTVKNITPVEHRVPTEKRHARNQHRGGVLWFTGLSGSGKSTLGFTLEEVLFREGFQVYVLDGDNVRGGLNRDVDFSPEGRAENIRRIGEVAALFADAGLICISAFISPYRADRATARAAAGEKFHEVFVDASVETCEQRDPKGLYQKARRGEIQDFTGISAPYEPPEKPELVVNTNDQSIGECIEQLATYVRANFKT